MLNILVWQDVQGRDGEDEDGEMMVVRNVCDTALPRYKCVAKHQAVQHKHTCLNQNESECGRLDSDSADTRCCCQAGQHEFTL